MLFSLQSESQYEADFDNDNDVDYDDLVMWEQAFGTSDQGDADGDGDTDSLDFFVWQRQVGSGAALTAAVQTVPEPSALVLVMIGVISAGRRRVLR